MSNLKFEVKVTATGEVRDADGNLLSAEPVEAVMVVTEDELNALGLAAPTEES